MKWISTVQDMRETDLYANRQLHIPTLLLMEQAALSVAERLMSLCQKDDDILILCGSGGNGGDGFALARLLKEKGYNVRVFFVGDPARLRGAALVNYQMLPGYQISVLTMDQASAFHHLAEQSEWVVDALLGTGLNRHCDGMMAQIIHLVNQLKDEKHFKVLSIDIPSGIQADTGKVMGEAIRADETVALCHLKRGHLLYPGRDYAGRVSVGGIGIPQTIPSLQKASAFLLEDQDMAYLLPKRKSRSHKGLYGKLLILAGSPAMPGALSLASRSAYKMGVGLVKAAADPSVLSILQGQLPEAVGCPLSGDLSEKTKALLAALEEGPSAVCAGPGLGQGEEARALLAALFEKLSPQTPLIIDADALNLLAIDESLRELVRRRDGQTILTPHMGEASRLLGKEIADIMADPEKAVYELADTFRAIAVLKDAMTLVCNRDHQLFFNTTGNNGMSTAGSGDVLLGMIGGLVAQRQPLFEAACCGVYLHGRFGDLSREAKGAYGMLASDIIDHINIDAVLEA